MKHEQSSPTVSGQEETGAFNAIRLFNPDLLQVNEGNTKSSTQFVDMEEYEKNKKNVRISQINF